MRRYTRETPHMSVSTTFKQKCPSCQASMTIRDAKLIGKKVECPKCKYKFVVEDPGAKAADSSESTDKLAEAATKSGNGENAVEELSEHDIQSLLSQKQSERDAKSLAEEQVKPKKPAKQKLTIGLALAGVGLVVLEAAGYFILNDNWGGDNQQKTPIRQAS